MFEENQTTKNEDNENDMINEKQMIETQANISIKCPYRLLSDHWLTLSRPQYQRTCGISSLVSIWNYQFSKLGKGNRQPICIEQVMLKLNIIGNDSIGQKMKRKYKKTAQLTQNSELPKKDDTQCDKTMIQKELINNDKNLFEYINSIDFGCFTGNDTLLKWYRLLCRIYGGYGRSYIFYKINSNRSRYKNEQTAKKQLIEGLNSQGKLCFIYHAHDHYFCPVGYQFIPQNNNTNQSTFQSSNLQHEMGELWILVGQSSKMFPCLHNFKWSEILTDLSTYPPQFYNIRRKQQNVQFYKGKENQASKNSTINCIMAFQKIKD